MKNILRLIGAAAVAALPLAGAAADVKITAANRLALARPSQTIELTAQQLAPVGQNDLTRIHITEGGKEVLSQAVDTDGDYTPDIVIFQSDFGPNETKSFTAGSGEKIRYTADQFKTYGRFNRERFDDFVWENDKIGNRMYGKALETWKREPLTSSGVDAWTKRTNRLVVNDWYMTDNYHADQGEGADLYSVGPSRGCGGNGIWDGEKLWLSKNFVDSRVLAQGPIRVSFELKYEPFDAAGKKVTETKRISLDAGQQFNHFRSMYEVDAAAPLMTAIGINKTGVKSHSDSKELGYLATWQPMKNADDGELGCAVIVNPANFEKAGEDNLNHLLVAKVPENNVAEYWAGFGWTKGGIADEAAWKTRIEEFAQGLQSPIEVSVGQ